MCRICPSLLMGEGLRVGVNQAAAAQANRVGIGHAEIGAYTAYIHRQRRHRGKPCCSTPISVVVPPTSTTMASRKPLRKAAPRILLVGPEAKVSTGYSLAKSAFIKVPSFWLM